MITVTSTTVKTRIIMNHYEQDVLIKPLPWIKTVIPTNRIVSIGAIP